jgi:hypothetical protein
MQQKINEDKKKGSRKRIMKRRNSGTKKVNKDKINREVFCRSLTRVLFIKLSLQKSAFY